MSRDGGPRSAAWRAGSLAALTLSTSLYVKVADAQTSPKPGSGKAATSQPNKSSPITAYQMTPKQPGVVKLKRRGHVATLTLKKNGALTPDGLDGLADLLKDKSGDKHAIDPRFAELFVTVSDHFGGRVIEVVGGYRPPPAHSNHTVGKAIDFRVDAVPIEAVRDYCQTLEHSGVGYYPGGKFVHLDWRNQTRQWTDETPLLPTATAPKGSTHTPQQPSQPSNTTSGTKQSPPASPPSPHK